MLKPALVLICGLLALNGAMVESESVCLKDPLNQCGGFCLSVLTPVLNHMTMANDHQNSSDPIKAKEVLVRQYTMERQLDSLLEKQSSFETFLDTQRETLNITQQNQTERQNDLERQLLAIHDKLHKLEVKIKYLRYEQIGPKYYYIEKYSEKDWSSASKACRYFGGHLADIASQKELDDLQDNLKEETHYWIGISDLTKKGEYFSMATGKQPTFLKWAPGHPTQLDTSHCVFLYNGQMYDYSCNFPFRFICQTEEDNY